MLGRTVTTDIDRAGHRLAEWGRAGRIVAVRRDRWTTGPPSDVRVPTVPRPSGVSETGRVVEVVLLGTGTPLPDPARCGSGVAVVHDGRWILVDCGPGVTRRVEAGLDTGALEGVVLTHHDSDHVSDLATLSIVRWVAGAQGPLTVFAPRGPCGRFARRCLDGFDDQAFSGQAGPESPLRPTVAVDEFQPVGCAAPPQ